MVMSPKSRPVDYGCSYLLWMAVVVVALIVVNGAVVELILARWALSRPGWMEDPRIVAGLGKVGPFVLLVFQYWVFDFFADRWRKHPLPGAAAEKESS